MILWMIISSFVKEQSFKLILAIDLGKMVLVTLWVFSVYGPTKGSVSTVRRKKKF